MNKVPVEPKVVLASGRRCAATSNIGACSGDLVAPECGSVESKDSWTQAQPNDDAGG
jgi:hypothetical protein